MKYQKWLNEWLTTCVEPVVKVRTLERYTDIVRLQIVPRIGGYEMSDLTPTVLQSFTAELSEKYASSTVNGIISVIKSSLARAQKMQRVKRQYSDAIEYPKHSAKTIQSFTRDEQKKIEQYIFDSGKPKLYGILLCLYTGLRIGELLALEWENIDFTHRRISITKTCTDKWVGGNYKKVIGPPKTNSSVRIIPLPVQLVQYLKALKKHGKSNFVISGAGGKEIRHTFATRALECGMDVKSLSKILGHKSSVVTLNRYAHSFWEHQNSMMNRLGKMLTTDAVNS